MSGMTFQRIRDPLHNLIEFNGDFFERNLWNVIQSRPFQRLRRIKQLGFSEFVYPGATHTRFAHSLGVFHTARMLMQIIRRTTGENFDEGRSRVALTAALLHDVGHGPFSHAFEAVGKKLEIPMMAEHEKVSDLLIRSGEIADLLKTFGSGFATDVADLIGRKGTADIYSAVVSSQFDADRLDYMRRDRLMTGTQHGAIDFDWLLSNLEVGEAEIGVDAEPLGKVPTFVLGPKAIYAAETYLLSLFQLYPTVYFHKATRGAERIFAELLYQVIALTQDGSWKRTGLPENHPIIKFANDPSQIEDLLSLDDTVVTGSLGLLKTAEDTCTSSFAHMLQMRDFLKCIDIREGLRERLASSYPEIALEPLSKSLKEFSERGIECLSDAGLTDAILSMIKSRTDADRLDRATAYVYKLLTKPAQLHTEMPSVIVDEGRRKPYKPMQESNGPLEQILIRSQKGTDAALMDVAKVSRVVAAIQEFKFVRAYIKRGDKKAEQEVQKAIEEGVRHAMAA